MNFIVRLITTALIAALAFVAVPPSYAEPIPSDCIPSECPTPEPCIIPSDCPAPAPEPCIPSECPTPKVSATPYEASVSAVDDLVAEVSALHAQLVAKDKRAEKDAARISRLRAKVQQLRERLRSR